ncbi:hypothetical protein [Ruminococcus sp.]|uniref:hypothetical protein n=1 Tax=Ruminococcus sp. TaxID=41978 RepID=UPI00388E403E
MNKGIIITGGDEMAKTKAEIQRDYAKRSGYKDQQKYAAKHTKQIALVLNTTTDADILRRLDDVPNKQGYIKELIRADIAKQK